MGDQGRMGHAPPPEIASRMDEGLKDNGVIATLAAVGALMVIGRMNQKHKAGENMMDGIESAVTGMILFGIYEHAKGVGRNGS